jgi:hypothetical protein
VQILNFNFIFNHPWWFIVLCLAAGAVSASLLYYKNRSDEFRPPKQWFLAGFRFLVISVLCFLLLAPLLQMRIPNTQDPVILVFHDNSQSLGINRNADYMTGEYPSHFSEFTNQLSGSFTTAIYGFGEGVRPFDSLDFGDRATDLLEVFDALDALYSNRNVGAVIIAGDGIYNRGRNPVFETGRLLFPVYTIALGDTLPQRDLIINRVQHNRITYLNNIFPLEVTIEARQAGGTTSRLRVFHQGETVFSQTLSFNSDNQFITIPIELEAQEVGIKRYRIEIDVIEDEVSVANNVREFFIEVIDSRQKVLILAASPHPDVGAIRLALDENQNYEAEVFLVNDFDKNLREFDIVIWHQLPSRANVANNLISQATQANMAQLFITGALTNYPAFNRLQTGLQFNIRAEGFSDSRAHVNNNFTLFQLSAEATSLMELLPPLQSPFASYSLSPAVQTMAYQKIGNVTTNFPLIAFLQTSDRKTGFITGEGIWRWRLNNFARNNNHDAFNELISRAIQFLSVVDDKSFFRVTTESFLMENQQALFEAELYNPSYELVNTPEVNLTITNDEGARFEYVFSRSGNAYRLNAGVFPVGEYTFAARTSLGNENFTAQGQFTVSALNIEGIQTTANHQLLYQLAENTGGKMFFPHQLDQLAQEIENRNDIKPVLYSQYRYEDLISLRWIFFLLLLLLSVEWFVRKYSGSY